MSNSQGFNRLHNGVQRWVWEQKWTELRDIQEQAIEPVLSGTCDVVISASTAAGKTEAAFLPACSRIAELSNKGIGILYISPLKALINDQYRRLQGLCEILDIPVTPWHGDVLASVKDKQRKDPNGIVLITPESLESLLLNHAGWCSHAFKNLNYIIIDEFHAFLGSERGCQLQSLMHRLEFLLQRTIPRIALSATLGDMNKVGSYLRPEAKIPCHIIESSKASSDLKVQLRGYVEPKEEDKEPSAFDHITEDLYKILRGKSHLVFANSRGRTEQLATNLSDLCEGNGVPNEFFPHHGSLAKELRESLEKRLHEEKFPTTAVCTMTLELGIDIGNVTSIAQVTAPHSVASLRQRLGRSGRRGDAAILRLFIPEDVLTEKSHVLDRLRLETVQSIAMVNLLLKKWYEPPPQNQYHFSTLLQQTLSVIGQYGGVRAGQLWTLLCSSGPFSLIDQSLYAEFLRGLADQDLITQLQDGQITLGSQGERLVEHYTFFTAFNTPEEYRLECDGRTLGTLPVDKPLILGQLVIFAGRRWEVLNIDSEKKVISLQKAKGGKPPKFGGNGPMIHDIIRQEILSVYKGEISPIYLDTKAKSSFLEGIECFKALQLDKRRILQIDDTVHIIPWLGDQIINTATILLRTKGLAADCFGGIIDIREATVSEVQETIKSILSGQKPSAEELAKSVPDTIVEKHDPLLSENIRNLGYGTKFFNVDGAWKFLSELSA